MTATLVRSAVISDDGVYRYSLTRSGWLTSGNAEGRRLVWVMLNPSTADGEVDDPTIRRVMKFTEPAGYPEAVIVNLFALRATDPKALNNHRDPVGPLNDQTLRGFGDDCEIVCAWGAFGNRYNRAGQVLGDHLSDRPLWCLGTTKDGHPRHPLYVRGDQPLVPYRPGS